MRKMLALLTTLALLALPTGALAEPRDADSRLLDSIAGLWNTAVSAFGDAFEATRDDEALKSAWDTLGARLKGAWAHVDEQFAALRAGAEQAGRSMGDWLDAHSADIDSIAQRAGEGMGELMNGLSGALNSLFD